jgi:hypothetical protein
MPMKAHLSEFARIAAVMTDFKVQILRPSELHS